MRRAPPAPTGEGEGGVPATSPWGTSTKVFLRLKQRPHSHKAGTLSLKDRL